MSIGIMVDKDFWDAIRIANMFKAPEKRNDSWLKYKCVLFEGREGRLRLFSCVEYAFVTIDLDIPFESGLKMYLDGKVSAIIEDAKPFKFDVSENTFTFYCKGCGDRYTITVKAIDCDVPNYEKVIPGKFGAIGYYDIRVLSKLIKEWKTLYKDACTAIGFEICGNESGIYVDGMKEKTFTKIGEYDCMRDYLKVGIKYENMERLLKVDRRGDIVIKFVDGNAPMLVEYYPKYDVRVVLMPYLLDE